MSRLVVGPVREVPLSLLGLWPGNPRRFPPEACARLTRSLEEDPEMLWLRPLGALPDGMVFAGNMKLHVAGELGWKSIPTLIVDLPWERARVWALRDNNHYGEWDAPLLAELLAELTSEGVDLTLTGFAGADLDQILASLEPPRDPDEAPPLPEREPQSKRGEIYELGRHRVACGSCSDRELMAELMQASKADLFWSDPPWGVNYSGKTREALTIENDEPDGLAELLTTAFPVAGELLRPATPFYLAAPTGPQGTVFRLALQAAGWLHRQSLAWVKNAHVLGHSDYHHRYEELLYGVTPGSGRSRGDRDRGSRWYGGRSQSDVFFVDRPARSTLHPTMKPVALIAAMLRNSSRRGEIVLDPFLGSGSTLIAAEQLGRVCYGAELDPRYVDVVLQRYEEYRDGA